MPQLTIYVDRDLAALIKRWKVPTSSTCQRALARQVRVAERKAAATGIAAPAAATADTAESRPSGGSA